jgi:hypothetical protein
VDKEYILHTMYNSDGSQANKKKHSEIPLEGTNNRYRVVAGMIPESPSLAKSISEGVYQDSSRFKLSVSIS